MCVCPRCMRAVRTCVRARAYACLLQPVIDCGACNCIPVLTIARPPLSSPCRPRPQQLQRRRHLLLQLLLLLLLPLLLLLLLQLLQLLLLNVQHEIDDNNDGFRHPTPSGLCEPYGPPTLTAGARGGQGRSTARYRASFCYKPGPAVSPPLTLIALVETEQGAREGTARAHLRYQTTAR